MPKPPFPDFVPPMKAECAKTPFDSPDWIFEIKLDGYRAITWSIPRVSRIFGPATDLPWKPNSPPLPPRIEGRKDADVLRRR